MVGSPRFTFTFRRWLASLGACLAIVAQLGVVLSPLGEAQKTSTASHVEPGGQQSHYAHNDADCAVCQARLHQGFAPRVPELPSTDAVSTPAVVHTVERLLALDFFSPASPRAPPVS
jgi:hypothetical protein